MHGFGFLHLIDNTPIVQETFGFLACPPNFSKNLSWTTSATACSLGGLDVAGKSFLFIRRNLIVKIFHVIL